MRTSRNLRDKTQSFVANTTDNTFTYMNDSVSNGLPMIRQSRNGSKDKDYRRNVTTADWRTTTYKPPIKQPIEEDLQEEVEFTLKSIQNLSIQLIDVQEEYDCLARQLRDKKRVFDKFQYEQGTKNNRQKVKGHNLQTDIKVLKQSTSEAFAECTRMQDNIEDFRRVNMHYKRANTNFLNKSVDFSLKTERQAGNQISAHTNVSNLLVSYKRGLHESINLRKAIQQEFVHDTIKNKGAVVARPPLENYITKLEPYQLYQKVLLKHRINVIIAKNHSRSELIMKYILRMQKLDKAFSSMKQNQAVENLDELRFTFERTELRQEQINTKTFLVCSRMKKYEIHNDVMERQIKDYKETLDQIMTDTTYHRLDKQLYNRKIRDMHDRLMGEISLVKREYHDCKDVLHESYKFWGESAVGKFTEMRKDLGEEAGPFFINQKTFDPIILMAWFEEMLANIVICKDQISSKDKSNLYNESTALNSQIVSNSMDTSEFNSSLIKDYQVESDGILQTSAHPPSEPYNPRAPLRRQSLNSKGHVLKTGTSAYDRDELLKMENYDIPYDYDQNENHADFLIQSELVDFNKIRSKNMNIILEKQNHKYMDNLATKTIRMKPVKRDSQYVPRGQVLSSNEGLDSTPSFINTLLTGPLQSTGKQSKYPHSPEASKEIIN